MMPVFIDITQLEYREIRQTILLVEGHERAQLQQQRQGLIVEQITTAHPQVTIQSEEKNKVFTIGNLPFSYLSTIYKENITWSPEHDHLKSWTWSIGKLLRMKVKRDGKRSKNRRKQTGLTEHRAEVAKRKEKPKSNILGRNLSIYFRNLLEETKSNIQQHLCSVKTSKMETD